MTYQKGSKILAADYNGFLNNVNYVYGVGYADGGYGQTAISQTVVSASGPVRSTQWVNLLNMITVCANQQGTNVSTLPPTSLFNVGANIIAEETAPPSSRAYEIAANITAIEDYRLNASDTSMSIATNVWTVSRATTWNNSIFAEISVVWASENAARYYFNSAGQIRLHGSQPGSTTPDENWNTALTTGVGTVNFFAHTTTNTGSYSGSVALGYYGLTDSYQTIFSHTGGGSHYYTSENILITAKRLNFIGLNGGNGNGVQFMITLSDSAPYVSTDITAGTNFAFDNVRATSYLSGIAAPTYTTISGF